MFWDPNGLHRYTIIVRSFAPFEHFGFGFVGDKRGFSLSDDVTSRIELRIIFDTDTREIIRVAALPSSSEFLPLSRLLNAPIKVGGENFGEATIKDLGPEAFSLRFYVHGKNHFTPSLISPSIDVHGFLLFSNYGGDFFNIFTNVTGDAFPSAEVIIEDNSGQRIFLNAHTAIEVTDKFLPLATGPFTSLWLDNNRPMGQDMEFRVDTDSKGNFTTIIKGTKINFGDGEMIYNSFFTVKEWNYLFERNRFETPIIERFILDSQPRLVPEENKLIDRIDRWLMQLIQDIYLINL